VRRIPATAQWEKPQGKNEPLKMEKNFRVVPRGTAPRYRLLYVPDLERFSRPFRGSSRLATRWSSSRIRRPYRSR
jgi:hypothetical protein